MQVRRSGTYHALFAFLGCVPFERGESLSERLRDYRRVHGLSRKKLAHLLGVDQSTLCRWETGARHPSRLHIERIENVLTYCAKSVSRQFKYLSLLKSQPRTSTLCTLELPTGAAGPINSPFR